MDDTKQKILDFIKEKGPVLPVDIAKHLETNILMGSAHLSELTSNGTLKISNVKVGGSPLYYLPGQQSQLQNFAENLHEKEKKAYDLLSEKKVLKDTDLEPVTRVALRGIKDYAVPLQVNFKDNSEIFWRWYLLSNKEAEELIKPLIKATAQIKKETPKKEFKPKAPNEITKETQTQINPPKEPPQKPIVAKTTQKPKPTKRDSDQFLNSINNYFNRNKINILNKEIIRKTEIDLIVQVPSAVGNIDYYCKSKNKKKINDADLASAFAQGQLRKLPVLFITNGDLTKRAKEILQKDFKGMNIIKV